METNNMHNEKPELDSNKENSVFSEVPQPTIIGYMINFMLSNWKIIFIWIIILFSGLGLWLYLSSDEPSDMASEKLSSVTSPTTIDNVLIEGIYYCEEEGDQNEEPFTATVTRSSNGKEHYLLSAQGQVCDFYLDREKGIITSQILGQGEISIDSVTTEIIIRFNRWILKHSN